jgi:hypothetical protein
MRARAVRGKLWIILANLLLRKPKPRERPSERVAEGHTTRTSTNVVGCEPERRLEEMRVKKKGLRKLS